MARRKSTPPVPVETPAGVGTVLPGVPLPSWALPAGPVAPEPPAPAPAPEPVLVAAYAVAETAPAAAPWPPAPEPIAMPVAAVVAEPAPVETWPPAPTAAPVTAYAPVESLPPVQSFGPDAPVPSLEPLPVPVALDAPPPMTAPLDYPAPDALVAEPGPRRHTRDDVVPDEPVKRRRFGRKAKAEAVVDDAVPAPMPEPVPVPVLAAAAAPAAVAAEPVAEAPRRSRRPLALLLVLLVVAALGAVAAFVWPGLLVAPSDDEVGGAVAKPKPKPAAVTLQVPAQAAGLTKLDGAPAQQLAAATAGTTLAGLTAPVSAVYGTGTTPSATVVAWTATTPPSATAVTDAFAGWVTAHGAPVTGLVDVKPGALGGQMRCGTSTVSGTPASVCFWADTTTLGTVTVLAPASPEAGAATAAAIRQAVETTS